MFSTTQFFFIMLTFAIAYVSTAWVGHFIMHKRLLDIPNNRSSHLVATPRGGGCSIVITFITASVLLFALSNDIPIKTLIAFVLGGIVVAAVGWLDDHRHLPPSLRVTVHFVVALFCITLVGIPTLPVAGLLFDFGWLGYPLAAISLVWCMNFFNFMDGIDGVASVQAITMALSAACILIFTVPDNSFLPYLFILVAATAGFLAWNWSPAKIFMGDAASGFLGLILGLFAIVTSVEGSMNIWSWLILFGVFGTDATVTLIMRFLRRETLHQAHRQHAYQRLAMNLQRTESIIRSPDYARIAAHRTVTLAISGINIFWLLPWALAATLDSANAIIYSGFALLPLVLIVICVRHIGGVRRISW